MIILISPTQEAFQQPSTGKESSEDGYDWALILLPSLTVEEQAWSHGLWVRISTSGPGEMAYNDVFPPREEVLLEPVASVVAARWQTGEGFEQPKDVCERDEQRVRKY